MSIVENSKIKLTYDDYVRFPEDGQRHEIIDGDHCVTPSPSSYHQSILSRLHYQLFGQIENTGRGRVLPAPMDVLLSKVDIVQPDILVVLEPRTIDITPKNVQCAPDLIVEILSEATADRDRRLKKSLYEKSGVAEYWIVDPESRAVEQHVLKEATGRFEDRARSAASCPRRRCRMSATTSGRSGRKRTAPVSGDGAPGTPRGSWLRA